MKPKNPQNASLPPADADVLERVRQNVLLSHALLGELARIEKNDLSDKRLAARFRASSLSLPGRLRVERLLGNYAELVIDPPCTLPQQAAIIEIAQRLSEKRGRHPVLEQLRGAFCENIETYAVLEMADELFIPDVAGLSRLYGNFAARKDQLGEKILRREIAGSPQKPQPGAPSIDL